MHLWAVMKTCRSSIFGSRSYFAYSSAAVSVYLVVKVMLLIGQADEFAQEADSALVAQGAHGHLQRRQQLNSREADDEPGVLPSRRWRRPCTSDRLGLSPTATAYCRKLNASSSATCEKLLTCRRLLDGQNESLAYLTNLSELASRPPLPNSALVNATSNCAAFRRRRGFVETTSPEAADFPIAYNILAHSNADQLARLLRAVYRPNNIYCIHVDVKASPDFRSAVASLAACFENVRLASQLESITWGGYSRLQADINCMRDHAMSGRDFRYVINTAAMAFPLRTVEETVKILRLYNGANDLEGIFGSRVLRGRFEKEFIERSDKKTVSKTGRDNPKPPHNIDIVRGSAYGIFSRGLVDFILNDKRANDLLKWSERTWSPDEFYWSTLHHTFANPHLHTPGAYSGYPSDKPWLAVYANWGEEPCGGRSVRGVCVFGVRDLRMLVRTRRELFANKFYDDMQPLALDCLDSWIRHKEQCPPPDDLEFYRQLPFIPQ